MRQRAPIRLCLKMRGSGRRASLQQRWDICLTKSSAVLRSLSANAGKLRFSIQQGCNRSET
jgi:hypothetical protein